jgi:peptide/nickel transport system substrate-binding protein
MTLLLSILLMACQSADNGETSSADQHTKGDTEQSEAVSTDEKQARFKESPVLTEKVKAGGLPSIEQRLPKDPKLTNELPPDILKYEIGSYGGTLRTVRTEPESDNTVFIAMNEPLLNTPGLLGQEITPNVLKGYEASSDQKEFTFHMREGLKWSDGQPVTVNDVKFAIEDVLFNKQLTPIFPTWLKSGGNISGIPMKFSVIDDYTFKIRFDEPYGGFPLQLAVEGWRGYTDLLKPEHFLKNYHIKYTPLEQLGSKIKEAGFAKDDWVSLFNKVDITNWEVTTPQAIGFPALTPWLLTEINKDTYIYKRNPYYFKVDARGNQLPYIDEISSIFVQNLEMATMKFLGGEVDHSYEFATPAKLPLYKENESKGGYKTYVNTKLHRTATDIFINLTYDDPVWRQVVQDVRFRKALNYALDKEEIVDSIYYGLAEPADIEDTTFDPEKGKKLLEEMGMKKGPDGLRLGPDGKRFTIHFEVAPLMSDTVSFAQLAVEQLKRLDLDVSLKIIDSSLWGQRNSANELQATVAFAPGPVMWMRAEWGQDKWAPLWNRWWISNGKEGEEPPENVKEFFKMMDGIRALPPDQAQKNAQAMAANMKENLWYLISTQNVIQPVCVNAKIANFTDSGFAIAQNFAAEQWFFNK